MSAASDAHRAAWTGQGTQAATLPGKGRRAAEKPAAAPARRKSPESDTVARDLGIVSPETIPATTLAKGDPVSRAFAAHFRTCAREGTVPGQPSNTSGLAEVNGKQYVVLENASGILRVYRIRSSDGILKELKRWPRELET